jgi:hypothetical protein
VAFGSPQVGRLKRIGSGIGGVDCGAPMALKKVTGVQLPPLAVAPVVRRVWMRTDRRCAFYNGWPVLGSSRSLRTDP